MQYIYTPTQLKELCARYGFFPSKQYGQHYLISDAPVKKIIEAGELTKDDTVIEIGPGFGVLTLAIAPLVKKVIAFEIEQKLKPYWEEKQNEFPNIEIIWGNFLNKKLLDSRFKILDSRYKVLANLPYSITSDALRVILETDPPPERVVVMVQKEVAERILARPPKMSLLSVAVQYFGEPFLVAKVSAGSFWPRPKVDSAIVDIPIFPHIDRSKYREEFFRIARVGFSHKRKQLWSNLANGFHLDPSRVKGIIHGVVGNEKVRAEELAVAHWQELSTQLVKENLV